MGLLSSTLLTICLLGKLCLGAEIDNVESIDFRDTETFHLGDIPALIRLEDLPPSTQPRSKIQIFYKVYTALSPVIQQPPESSSDLNPRVPIYTEPSDYGWALVDRMYHRIGQQGVYIGRRTWVGQARIVNGKWRVIGRNDASLDNVQGFVVVGRKAPYKNLVSVRNILVSTDWKPADGLPQEAANAKYSWVDQAVRSMFEQGQFSPIFPGEAT
ncbi:MAG: hypothetical protein M1829_002673 [Trizodia sp. TS-e1964]|nr:MAG: hypothetical protein M1829_002673 [Trizodia sp. TS-e1964]